MSQEDEMRKFLLLATAALGATALLGGAAYAQRGGGGFERGHHFQGHGGHGGHGGMHRRGGRGMGGMRLLRAADADGDNNITRAEVEELQDEMFAWSDRDGDGFLTDADRSPIAQRLAAIREADRAERFADDEDGEPRGRGRGRGGRGARGDADGDGRISREEFGTRGLRMFDRLDEDENGVVTPAELDASVERRRERRERRMFWWRD